MLKLSKRREKEKSRTLLKLTKQAKGKKYFSREHIR